MLKPIIEPEQSRMQQTSSHNPAPVLRPWLARLHPGLFAIPLGLLGLDGAWRRIAELHIPAASPLADALLLLGMACLLLLCLLWLPKLVLHWPQVKREFVHPVQGALLALLPVSILLAVSQLAPDYPNGKPCWLAVSLLALLLQGLLAWQVVKQLSTGQMPEELITPALYLPIVPGGMVGAMALKALELPGFAILLLGMGLGGWALLEMRILHRLFDGPLPLALRPTLGIEIAPAAVSGLAASVLWPQLPAEFLLIGLGIACGPVVAVLTRWHWWTSTPFTFSFWSFSFPLAALASVTIEVVRRGGWPNAVALAAVLLVSLIIAYLAVRTLLLLVRGQLLPQN
jgi:tellurite resistance protein